MKKRVTKKRYLLSLLAVLTLLSACVHAPPSTEQSLASEVYASQQETPNLQEEACEEEQRVHTAQSEDETQDTVEERVPNPYILALREEYGNEQIVGYLYVEGTDIRYPITQYTDNSFYLYHNIWRQADQAGWVFLDYENDITREDPNIILYGHNMRDNIRFHGIRHFQDPDFFDAHRYITFHTLYGEYRWEIFSFYRTNIDFFYIQVYFDSDEEFYELLAEMAARSMHESGIEVGAGDRVLTLSTCTNVDRDERFVVNARLIQEKEL